MRNHKISYSQHSQGFISVHLSSFQSRISPSSISAHNGCNLVGIPQLLCNIDDILVTRKEKQTLDEIESSFETPGRPWITSEEVFILSRLSRVLGKLLQCANGAYVAEESQSHTEGNQASECLWVAFIPGFLNYYAKFAPNLLILHSLTDMLWTNQQRRWTSNCDKAFRQAKQKLVSAPILAHYDPQLPIRMAGDASAYGVWVVISHLMPDGTEHPFAYVSRTLTTAEWQYAQVEK